MAASGGYLMASIADEIVASPFAIIGSIGVVATIPNFSERLTREGVSVEEVTAGQFKRTLTPYSKPTNADREKVRHDLQLIHEAFKNSIKKNRPNLNVNSVATGETWLATDALKHGLVDRIDTFDQLMVNAMHDGFALFEVQYISPRKRSPFGFAEEGSLGAMVAWASQVLLKEIYCGSGSGDSGNGGSSGSVTSLASKDPVGQMMIGSNSTGGSSGLPYTPMMYAGNVNRLVNQTTQQQEEQEE